MAKFKRKEDGTIEITDYDLMYELMSDSEVVSSELGNHGCEVTRLVYFDELPYLVTVLEHQEHGRQLSEQMPLTITPAKQVQVSTWVPK
jgi:hypothetical protein